MTKTIRRKLFWSKVKKRKSGCWEWTAGLYSNGYGQFRFSHKKTSVGAHRVSWFYHTGKWSKKYVLHTCDNKKCVRPNHLFEGTALDNALDCHAKGRGSHVYGEQNGHALLTEAKVKIIRLSHLPDRVWAKKFGVSIMGVNDARRGSTWKCVTTPPVRRQYQRPHKRACS